MSTPPRETRRSLLQTLGIAGTGVLGFGTLSTVDRATGQSASTPDDAGPSGWSSYHFDAGNTGYNPDGAGIADPLYRWRTRLDMTATGPVVGGDAVYTVQSGPTVTALDRETGQIRWLESADGEVDRFRDETALALADGTLFATLGGYVHAFDAADGTARWSVDTGGPDLSAPTVADGAVFATVHRGAFLALDAATGEERWRVEDGVGSVSNDDDVASTPAVAPDGSAVHFVAGGRMHALDPADGTERWRVDAGSSMAPVAADALYVSGHESVRSYALADGSLRWERTFDRAVDTTPTVADGRVFVQHNPAGVRALDASTGETRWTADLPAAGSRPTLVADGTHLYVPASTVSESGAFQRNEIVALDPADGTERWRFGVRGSQSGMYDVPHAVSAGDATYAVTGTEHVQRVDETPDGVRWRTEVADDPDRATVAGDGVVYAATTSGEGGSVAALEPGTGAVRWEVENDDLAGRPVASDDRCFYTAYYLLARNADDGSLAWRANFPGRARTGVRLHDGTLYVGWGDGDDALYAVDVADGSERWAIGEGYCDPLFSVGPATPVVVGDTLFAEIASVVSEGDGHVRGYDVADGSELWRSDVGVDELAAGPDAAIVAERATVRALTPDGTTAWTRELPAMVTGLSTVSGGESDDPGVVVARTAGGTTARFRALSLSDGSPLWEFGPDASAMTMPAVADGTAYAGTASGRLRAFDPATGEAAATYDAFHGLHDRPAVVDGTVAVPSDEGFVYGFSAVD